MPSSAPLSDSNNQPPKDTPAAGASPLDRVQTELKAVQQQALATQQALKKLQSHESVDPLTALLGDMPSPSKFDGTVVGLAGAVTVGLALLWWFAWQRPKARLMAMPAGAGHKSAAPSSFHPPSEFDSRPLAPLPTSRTRNTVPGGDTVAETATAVALDIDLDQPASSHFGRLDSGVGFDPQAAASEVMRVRKSLAEKREARAQILEREEGGELARTPSVRAWLDSGLSSAGALDTTPATEPAASVDPWLQPGESPHGDAKLALDDDGLEFSFSLPEQADEDDVVNVFDAEPPSAADIEHQLMELDHVVNADFAREAQSRAAPLVELAPEAVLVVPEVVAEPAFEAAHASAPEVERIVMPERPLEREPSAVATSEPHAMDVAADSSMDEPETAPPTTPTDEKPMQEDLTVLREDEHKPGHDYAVTLALAQESAELQLWPDARDLALEVLESHDEALREAAQDLLERINLLEQAVDPDTIPWDETR